MSKHKSHRDIGRGLKAVQHGQAQGIGPLFNVRHLKKFKPLDKETAAGAANTDGGMGTPSQKS